MCTKQEQTTENTLKGKNKQEIKAKENQREMRNNTIQGQTQKNYAKERPIKQKMISNSNYMSKQSENSTDISSNHFQLFLQPSQTNSQPIRKVSTPIRAENHQAKFVKRKKKDDRKSH